MSTHTPAPDYLTEFGREYLTTVQLLAEAQAVQWDAAPVPRPSGDTSERAKGGPPNDPTAAVALDERRLAVRDAVDQGAFALAASTAALRAARERLAGALNFWAGD